MELTYVGTQSRTYLFPGHTPIEAAPDGTYEVPYDPGDGQWQQSGPDAAPAPAPEHEPEPAPSAVAAPDTSKEA